MMTNLVLKRDFIEDAINELNKMVIGFDEFFQPTKSRLSTIKLSDNFPPYNIYRTTVREDGKEETLTTLELALAGFKKENIRVSIDEHNVLTIETKPDEKDKKENEKVVGYTSFHRGIACRDFKFVRTLQPNMYVDKVSMADGVLSVIIKTRKDDGSVKVFDID